MTHSPQLGDVQSPCCPCVSSRSQLKVKYLTNKYYTLCRVRSITPLLMDVFPSHLNDTFTSTRGCAEPMLPMCQLKVKVTAKDQIFNKQIYSQTCINGHLDIAWPCPTRSAATFFQSQTRKICPITVTIECIWLQFSWRVKISRYTIANQATVNETGLW